MGIKPTVGLISRSGIIPISKSQDTAGPMARTVTDAAILLGALTGVDPRDEATAASHGKSQRDYTRSWIRRAARRADRCGAKIFPFEFVVAKILESALEQMKVSGPTLVDFSETSAGGGRSGEWEVFQYNSRTGSNAYLAGLGPKSPMKTLQDLIDFNEQNQDREAEIFGQETFLKAQAKGPLTDQAYLDALARGRRLSRDEGIDAVMEKNQFEAIVVPSGGPAGPTITFTATANRAAAGAGGGGGLSEHHGAGGIFSGNAGGHFVFRPGLQRGNAVEICVRVRAGDEGAPGAEIFADDWLTCVASIHSPLMNPPNQPAAGTGTADRASERFPPQIKFIIGNEACERFSYYGMLGILELYLKNRMQMGADDATEVAASVRARRFISCRCWAAGWRTDGWAVTGRFSASRFFIVWGTERWRCSRAAAPAFSPDWR